jgi:hypothetical protein
MVHAAYLTEPGCHHGTSVSRLFRVHQVGIEAVSRSSGMLAGCGRFHVAMNVRSRAALAIRPPQDAGWGAKSAQPCPRYGTTHQSRLLRVIRDHEPIPKLLAAIPPPRNCGWRAARSPTDPTANSRRLVHFQRASRLHLARRWRSRSEPNSRTRCRINYVGREPRASIAVFQAGYSFHSRNSAPFSTMKASGW